MEPSHDSLLRRLESIEERLTLLQRRVDAIAATTDASQSERVKPSRPEDFVTVTERPRLRFDAPTAPTLSWKDRFQWTAEDLLKWAGIALVLFAVAFFFKYAIDQGWLTPAVRVVLGLFLGFVLVGLGLSVRAGRPGFSQVL